MRKSIEESIAESKSIPVIDSFSQGFNIVFKKPFLFIGFIILQFLIALLLSAIPSVSLVNSFVLQPLFMVGLLVVADKINYQEAVNFADFFEGFRNQVGTILLANLLMFLAMIPAIAIMAFGYIRFVGMENLQAIFARQADTVDPATMDPSGTNSLLMLVGALVVMALALLFVFIFHMVRFKNLSATEAVSASAKLAKKRFGGLVLFMLMALVVNLAGALLLLIGLLVTIPATYCALYVVFDDLVGARDTEDELMDHLINTTV